MKSIATKSLKHYESDRVATENDPLLLSSPRGYNSSHTIRERRPTTASAISTRKSDQQYNRYHSSLAMRSAEASHSVEGERSNLSRSYDQETAAVRPSSYDIYNGSNDNIRSMRSMRSIRSAKSPRGSYSRAFSERERYSGRTDKLHDYYNERAKSIFSEKNEREEPLVEVSEEIMAVRRRALRVYEPLTYTWLIFSVGFSICASLSMARWTGLLPNITYWFLLLPCWSSHIGLFVCHVYSAKTLFNFITEANNRRQRADSTDHLDRSEYLPLLQRALKFGLKTGCISSLLFFFEILLYIRLAFSSISMTMTFTPIWIIVVFGIIDGIICKTQHITRVLSWFLALSFMVLLVLKTDYGYDDTLRLRTILSPLVPMFAIGMGALCYILYGHRIGYFRLSDSQLSAGILYLLGALGISILFGICINMHMARPNIFEMRVVMVALAPLSVALMGLGAWAITRDEFDNLLHYGGQSSIQPKKLRLDQAGWTAVDGKGAITIPMFGEISYKPLDPSTKPKIIELCACCACYPYEDEEEMVIQNSDYPAYVDSVPGLRVPSSTIG